MQKKKAGLLNTNHAEMTKINDKTSWMWYILMGMYLVYFAQSTLFPGAAIIGQGLIFLILLIGLVSLIRTLLSPTPVPGPLKWIIALLIVLTIAYILSPKFVYSRLLSTTSTLNQFKATIAFYIPIFTGYQIGLHKRLPQKQWLIIGCMILFLAINSYYKTQAEIFQKTNLEQATNNAGYVFLYIIPLLPLFLEKFKLSTFIFLATIFIFVMMAAKRGAIICMALMLLYGMKWYLGSRMSIKTFIIIALVLLGVYIGIQYFISEDDFLQQRFEQTVDGNSSGRNHLYEELWNAWLRSDIIAQLFGHGTAQTVMIVGNYAHNDWLELLTDCGLLGAIFYLSIFVSLFIFQKRIPKRSPLKCTFSLIVLFWFLRSIFSMGMSEMAGISILLLGTIIGNTISLQQQTMKLS